MKEVRNQEKGSKEFCHLFPEGNVLDFSPQLLGTISVALELSAPLSDLAMCAYNYLQDFSLIPVLVSRKYHSVFYLGH